MSTPATAPSPSYQNLQPAPAQQPPHFAPPSYGNRNPPHNSNLNATFSRPNHIPLNTASTAAAAAAPNMASPLTPNPAPATPGTQQQQYTNQAFAPAVNAPNTPGTMGPPTGRPQREYEYDVTDSLMGTGVNIRDEENALAEYYAGSYGQEARTGLPANEPGTRASLYGAGFANQPGEGDGGLSQKEFEAKEAERVFNESASRLAATRSVEHNDPFLNFANLHKRMQDVAQSHGLELNLDNKNNPQQAHIQKTRSVADLPVPKLTITTKVGPDGALVAINGSIVPTDSFLADQLTLLSLGTKHRIRGLVTECDKLATHRQTTSHGKMPMCWSSESGKSLDEAGFYDPNDGTNGSGENNIGGEHGADNGMDETAKRKRKPTIAPFLLPCVDANLLLQVTSLWCLSTGTLSTCVNTLALIGLPRRSGSASDRSVSQTKPLPRTDLAPVPMHQQPPDLQHPTPTRPPLRRNRRRSQLRSTMPRPKA